MTRILACIISAACVITTIGIGAQQQQDQQQPVFRGATDAVPVYATVTDRDGRLVTTLTRDSFEVRDEGKPQPITLFDNTPRPIRLIVMLDVSGSMQGNLQLLRASTAQLLKRLSPDDAARIGTFGRDVAINPAAFTRDPGELINALPTDIAGDAPTPLWRSLDTAMNGFGDTQERRVILVLTDGKDSGMTSFNQRFYSQVEIIDRARREDVMIYAVGMRSRSNRPPPGLGPGGLQAMLTADLPDPGLARVAEETGGGFAEIRGGEDLGAEFARIADELHSQYLLGFAPPRRDGKPHDVEVKVLKGGFKPRARKTYIAPKE